MSYEVGLRSGRKQIPTVKWNRKTCVMCGEELWVPGPRTHLKAACSDHNMAVVIGSHSHYLEAIASVD